MQRSANRLCGRAALFYDHPIIFRLFSMPALSRTQEQLNFFSDLIAAATILATKALGEITLWPGFGVWRWSTATSPSNPHPAKDDHPGPDSARQSPCVWGENPLMEFARSNLESL
jgi:hypothetical protein